MKLIQIFLKSNFIINFYSKGPGKSVISFRTNPDDESLSMFYQVPNVGDYSLIIK